MLLTSALSFSVSTSAALRRSRSFKLPNSCNPKQELSWMPQAKKWCQHRQTALYLLSNCR